MSKGSRPTQETLQAKLIKNKYIPNIKGRNKTLLKEKKERKIEDLERKIDMLCLKNLLQRLQIYRKFLVFRYRLIIHNN
jgi:hypothetical protein